MKYFVQKKPYYRWKHQRSNVTLNNRGKDSERHKMENAKNNKDNNIVDAEVKQQATKNDVNAAKRCQRSVACSIIKKRIHWKTRFMTR